MAVWYPLSKPTACQQKHCCHHVLSPLESSHNAHYLHLAHGSSYCGISILHTAVRRLEWRLFCLFKLHNAAHIRSFADVGCRASDTPSDYSTVHGKPCLSAKYNLQGCTNTMPCIGRKESLHLKHSIIEDGGLPASLRVVLVVCQAPDVSAASIALQVEQHNGFHAAGDAHRLPLAIYCLHLLCRQAALVS